ncbi:hypothetical protein V6N11_036373 [Hibiscus sabdariffa]|uniref:Uncharacterized protein n=1 Tax=Hibiscus sabdariffa TaxID=183260 RepID=A0ABR2RAS0_9ROSI
MFISLGEIPPSSFQSKTFIRDPNIRCNIRFAKGNHGHIRRPAPNGINSKFPPFTSIPDPKNLSGMNLFGFSQMFGSLPIAYTLTNTCESLGTVKPQRSALVLALCGSNSGRVGCIRKVSLTMACRYGKQLISDSSTGFPLPIACLSSSLALTKTSGFPSSSAIAHSNVFRQQIEPAMLHTHPFIEHFPEKIKQLVKMNSQPVPYTLRINLLKQWEIIGQIRLPGLYHDTTYCFPEFSSNR